MAQRPDRIGRWVQPTVRFVWGLLLIGVMVFAVRWEVKAALTVESALLALLAGKRISFQYFAFLIATVAVFHLFLPYGKVYFQLGPWPITEGALLDGWTKGLTLCGLVFISLFAISRNLKIPGGLGTLWAKTFSYYERLLEERRAVRPRALLMSIDRIMERLYPTRPVPVVQETPAAVPTGWPRARIVPRTSAGGWALVVFTTLPFLWAAFFWK